MRVKTVASSPRISNDSNSHLVCTMIGSRRQRTYSQKEKDVKRALRVTGFVFIVMGTVWFLQGINILPGSIMTGQIRWAVYGAIAVIIGCALFVYAQRRRN